MNKRSMQEAQPSGRHSGSREEAEEAARDVRGALVPAGAAVDGDGVVPDRGAQEGGPVLLARAEQRRCKVQRPHRCALRHRLRRHAGLHLLVAGLEVHLVRLLALHAGACAGTAC